MKIDYKNAAIIDFIYNLTTVMSRIDQYDKIELEFNDHSSPNKIEYFFGTVDESRVGMTAGRDFDLFNYIIVFFNYYLSFCLSLFT